MDVVALRQPGLTCELCVLCCAAGPAAGRQHAPVLPASWQSRAQPEAVSPLLSLCCMCGTHCVQTQLSAPSAAGCYVASTEPSGAQLPCRAEERATAAEARAAAMQLHASRAEHRADLAEQQRQPAGPQQAEACSRAQAAELQLQELHQQRTELEQQLRQALQQRDAAQVRAEAAELQLLQLQHHLQQQAQQASAIQRHMASCALLSQPGADDQGVTAADCLPAAQWLPVPAAAAAMVSSAAPRAPSAPTDMEAAAQQLPTQVLAHLASPMRTIAAGEAATGAACCAGAPAAPPGEPTLPCPEAVISSSQAVGTVAAPAVPVMGRLAPAAEQAAASGAALSPTAAVCVTLTPKKAAAVAMSDSKAAAAAQLAAVVASSPAAAGMLTPKRAAAAAAASFLGTSSPRQLPTGSPPAGLAAATAPAGAAPAGDAGERFGGKGSPAASRRRVSGAARSSMALALFGRDLASAMDDGAMWRTAACSCPLHAAALFWTSMAAGGGGGGGGGVARWSAARPRGW